MSMTPESPLFSTYEVQLDEQVSELAFTKKINDALDIIDNFDGRPRDVRLMMDCYAIGNLVMCSSLPDATQLGRSIYTDKEQGNTNGQPTLAYVLPGFDGIERGGAPCKTHVAKLQTSGYPTYSVYRLIVAPAEQKTLPDGRGYYVARNSQDSTVTMFQVKGESYDRSVPLRAGDSYLTRLELVVGERRQPVLDELEKAAGVVKGLPSTPRRTR